MMKRRPLDLPDDLLARLPEIAQELKAGIQEWREQAQTDPEVPYGESPGPYYVFDPLLVPIVDRLGSDRSSRHARATLEKLFAYLEELLADHPNVADVAKDFGAAVLRGPYPDALEACLKFGGPGLKEHLELLRAEYEAAQARSLRGRLKRWLGIGTAGD